MYSVMLSNIIITLRKKLSSSDMANEENSEWYYLTKQYVTTEYSEEYGEDIFTGHLVFQSVIEDNGIKKIKTITVSEEFYYFDYLENATITFSEEVVDIAHCCDATLSSSGWYRIATATDSGTSGSIYHFTIGRKTVAGVVAGQAHSIDFFSVGGGKSAFINEVSDANSLYIDKIRCTYGNDLIHFDVHYSSSNSADVFVDFTVEGNTFAKQTVVAESLQAVADSPSGETILATHNFRANKSLGGFGTKTQVTTFPFTAPTDGLFFVTIRASATGRLYANWLGVFICDGYQSASGYVNTTFPVEKGTILPSPTTSNVSASGYYWYPLE